MLTLTFGDSVTSQQKAWVKEALSRMTWAKDLPTVTMELKIETVDEPPCPGHSDYMCTEVLHFLNKPPETTIWMRTGVDDPTQSWNAGVSDNVKNYFMESIVHEYAHAITFIWLAGNDGDRQIICNWFTHEKTGRRGTLADWQPDDAAWEDMIVEGLAEWFKDLYMPEGFRYFANQTNWWFDKNYFSTWHETIEAFLCPPTPVIS